MIPRITSYGHYVVGKRGGSTAPVRITSLGVYVLGKKVPNINPSQISHLDPDNNVAILQRVFHNWVTSFEVETSWKSDVIEAFSLAEDRRSLVDKPTRRLGARFTGMSQPESEQILELSNIISDRRHSVPISSDRLSVWQQSQNRDLFIKTKYRRFFPGGTILIVNHVNAESGINYLQYYTIDKVYEDKVTLVQSLSTTIPVGADVFPVLECEIKLTSTVGLITDQNHQINMTFEEAYGGTSISATTFDRPSNLVINPVDKKPVYVAPLDWSSVIQKRVFRPGSQTTSGRGLITYTAGARPLVGYDLPMTSFGRELFWQTAEIFDYAQGRTHTFWFVSPDNVFSIVSRGQNFIRVRSKTRLSTYQRYIPYIAIVLFNGEVEIRKVNSVTPVITNEYLVTFDTAGAHQPEEVDYITTAYLVRFNKDVMKERWVTEEHCRMSLEIREVVNEKEVEILNIPEDYEVEAPGTPPPFMWFQASSNVYRSNLGVTEDPYRIYPAIPNLHKVNLVDDVRRSPSGMHLLLRPGTFDNITYVNSALVPARQDPVFGGRNLLKFSPDSETLDIVSGGGRLWTNNLLGGFAMLCMVNRTPNVLVDSEPNVLFNAKFANGEDAILFTDESVLFRTAQGGPPIQGSYALQKTLQFDKDTIWAMHWIPGNSIVVRMSSAGTALTQVIVVPAPALTQISGNLFTYSMNLRSCYLAAFMLWNHFDNSIPDSVDYLNNFYSTFLSTQ